MVSFGGSRQASSQRNQSRATFPGAFLEDFGGAFGRGVSLEELLSGLPRSSSLFGGGPVGILPTGNQAPPTELPYNPVTATPALYWQRQQVNQQRGNPGIARTGGSPGLQPQGGAAGTGFPGAPMRPSQRVDPAVSYQGPGFTDPNAPVGPRFQASGSSVGGLDVIGGLQRLGFMDAPPDFTAGSPTIRNLPTINAPTVDPAQMNLGGGNLQRFEDSIFRSQFDPVRRELQRTGAEDDRRLQAELAQSGLASSGSGIGQVAEQRADRSRQIEAAASDASARAAAQRYGYEFSQAETNANMQQQARLTNAGLNMQAQTENAANILRGDTARSDAYLKTIGLNQQAGQALRADFLKVMDLAEADLARMDDFQQQTLSMLLNNWLQQGALAGNIGRESEGRGQSHGSSFNVGILS